MPTRRRFGHVAGAERDVPGSRRSTIRTSSCTRARAAAIPIFYVAERGEQIELLKRRTEWFKVRT